MRDEIEDLVGQGKSPEDAFREVTAPVEAPDAIGASSGGIVSLFLKNFIRLVVIANAIAWPVGYFITHRWLQDYAYRTPVGVQIFALAGAFGLLTALLSVGWQTLRAAAANPVESLRYE